MKDLLNADQVLGRSEMKKIMAGSGVYENTYGCIYEGGKASCISYFDCLTWVCASKAAEEGWNAADCVEEVQRLRLNC